MTYPSLLRLMRIHPKYHTTGDEACRICTTVWDNLPDDFLQEISRGFQEIAAGRGVKWAEIRRAL